MIKLSFLGDIMCLKAQNEASVRKYGVYNFDEQFAACKCIVKASDYVIGNLETPICPSQPLSEHSLKFNSSIAFLKSVQTFGVQFLSLANNHILDQGIEGIDETIDCVEQHNIDYSGSYKNQIDSDTVFVKDINGIRFAILCFTFGTNSQVNGNFLNEDELWRVDLLNKQKKMLQHWEPDFNAVCEEYIPDEISIAAINNQKNVFFQDRIKDKLQKAKECADIVIVMPHVGGQFNPHPGNYARWMMDFLKTNGADMIIAGHPHVPQKCLWDGNVFECYSLGNFACTPNEGWYLPNSFSEYGICIHILKRCQRNK